MTPQVLFKFIRNLVGVRIVAAAFSLLSYTVAYYFLGANSYSDYSLIIALSGVYSLVIFTPFSKYTLLANTYDNIESSVLGIAFLLLLVSFIAIIILGERWTYAVLFASSQGLKEFFVEKFRVKQFYKNVFCIYLADAIITFSLYLSLGFFNASHFTFVISSAISSYSVVLVLAYKSNLLRVESSLFVMCANYLKASRVSIYILASGLSVNALIYQCRNLLTISFGNEIGGHLNYVLDMIQRPISLISSSIITTLIPVRDAALKQKINVFSGLFLLICCAGLFVLAKAISYLEQITGATKFFIAPNYAYFWVITLVFMNRLKSTMTEVPLYKAGSGHFLIISSVPIGLCAFAMWSELVKLEFMLIVPFAFLASSLFSIFSWGKNVSRIDAVLIISGFYALITLNLASAFIGFGGFIMSAVNMLVLLLAGYNFYVLFNRKII